MDWKREKRKPVVWSVNKAYNLLGCLLNGVKEKGRPVDNIWHGMPAGGKKRSWTGLLTNDLDLVGGYWAGYALGGRLEAGGGGFRGE